MNNRKKIVKNSSSNLIIINDSIQNVTNEDIQLVNKLLNEIGWKVKIPNKKIKFDIYINASNNSYYSRDKQIYLMQDSINNVFPLSINSKKFCEYDYYFDNSLDMNSLLSDLNTVDAWLFRFGIDYKKISEDKKYNLLNLNKYKPQDSLFSKITQAKRRGKLLLFHPYSANVNKSIPQNIAIEFVENPARNGLLFIDECTDDCRQITPNEK